MCVAFQTFPGVWRSQSTMAQKAVLTWKEASDTTRKHNGGGLGSKNNPSITSSLQELFKIQRIE